MPVEGGEIGCQGIFEQLLARDFGNVLYFRSHRMLVDTYALQHPERYCVSAKSLAAHLTGLCWLLERDGNRAIGGEELRRWLNGPAKIEKPARLPDQRGDLTIRSVLATHDPESHARAVEAWARSTWQAYAALHPLARRWIDAAVAQESPKRGER
jgi:Family of unknown function (DUF5946)